MTHFMWLLLVAIVGVALITALALYVDHRQRTGRW